MTISNILGSVYTFAVKLGSECRIAVCGDDLELRDEIDSLLHHERETEFLADPVLGVDSECPTQRRSRGK